MNIVELVSFPITVGQFIVLFIVTLFGTAITVIPPLIFLLRGWPTKLKQILNDFDPDTIRYYFSKFWPNERIRGRASTTKGKTGSSAKTLLELSVASSSATQQGAQATTEQNMQVINELKLLYDSYFGRALYIMPIFLLGFVSMISIGLSVRSGLYFSQKEFLGVNSINQTPHLLFDYATISGVTGAFLWIVGDGFNRMRVGDYLPSDVYGHLLRLTVAIPLGLALASLGSGIGPFLAFSAGTFPLDVISRFIRTSATKTIGATDDADTDGDEIKRIVGINNDVAHRLMAENIATVLALANCDPIRVMMRTNLDFDVVLDIMDQAIVASRLITSDVSDSNKIIDVFRMSSLARASEINQFLLDRDKKDPDALNLWSKLPALVQLDAAQLSNTIKTIAHDDKTQLVCKLKRSSS